MSAPVPVNRAIIRVIASTSRYDDLLLFFIGFISPALLFIPADNGGNYVTLNFLFDKKKCNPSVSTILSSGKTGWTPVDFSAGGFGRFCDRPAVFT
jgi:hypothetical protein